MSILEVKDLTKVYKAKTVVDQVSFSLKEGEILGILGPNGAGKTTTMQMIMGILTPTRGSIQIFGKDLARHRSLVAESMNFSSTPFSAVYYPLSILPGWAKSISLWVPTSYVFEAVRGIILTGTPTLEFFPRALGLCTLYLTLSIVYMRFSYRIILMRGLIGLE